MMRTRPVLALLILPFAACIWAPTNRSTAKSEQNITIYGLAGQAGDGVTFKAIDHNTNTQVSLPALSTTANTSPLTSISSNLYFWSETIAPLAANFWAPQNPNLNGLNNSLGRLELFGNTTTYGTMVTFTPEAQECVWDQIDAGDTAEAAGLECYDGTSLVLFDNDGVGNGPPATGWVPDYTTVDAVNLITWQLGHYQVQGKDIYGLLCYPTPGPGPTVQYRTVIVNHGGYGPINDCVLQTFCIENAKHGWVSAMSIYRGQQVNVTVPGVGLVTRTSQGNIELCLGEVTDVLRLTDLVRARADTDDANMLMWGHSHGGCVTTRAVEQGVKVKAAAAFAGPTNFLTWGAPLGCMLGPGVNPPPNDTSFCPAPQNPSCRPGTWADPVTDAKAYRWRSPTHFSADLKARSDVKFLMLYGTADPIVPASQGCELSVGAWGASGKNWLVPASTPVPSGCNTVTWQSSLMPPAPVPTVSWPAQQYLLMYGGLDHGTILGGQAWIDFTNFVKAQFGP